MKSLWIIYVTYLLGTALTVSTTPAGDISAIEQKPELFASNTYTEAPDANNTSVAPAASNTTEAPETNNTSVAPASSNTTEAPETNNTSVAPASSNTTEAPETNNTSVAPAAISTTVEPVTNVTTLAPVTTTAPDNSTGYPEYVGFITAGVAVVFFGSNFVPVKKFETGDGMFFQWVVCIGIWLTGIVMQIVRQSKFYPLVMLGGAIWGTGNICVVPIIKTIGLGLGLCIWGMFNLLAGWASARFGWFGIKPEVPHRQALNYVGVALAVSSSVIYIFVKNEVSEPNLEMTVQVDDEKEPLVDNRGNLYGTNPQEDVLVFNKRRSGSINSSLADQPESEQQMFIEKLSPFYKKIVGVTLSVFSGILYGLNFAPAIHVQDNYKDASQNSLDYVFAQYCGILLTSTVYFLIYCAIKKSNPQVYPKVILPAIASGIMWGIACIGWFVSNKALSEPVSFPIITTGPGALASLFWGVCIFKEIRGKRNILILLLAFSVTAAGAVLAGVSKG